MKAIWRPTSGMGVNNRMQGIFLCQQKNETQEGKFRKGLHYVTRCVRGECRMRHLFSVPNRGKEVFVKAPLRHIYSYDISRLEVLP